MDLWFIVVPAHTAHTASQTWNCSSQSCSLDRFNGAGKGSEDLTLLEVSLALNPSRTKGNLLIMATSVVHRN